MCAHVCQQSHVLTLAHPPLIAFHLHDFAISHKSLVILKSGDIIKMSPEIVPVSWFECSFPDTWLCFEKLWSLKGEGSSWRVEVPEEMMFQAFQPPTSSFQSI